MEVLDGLGFIEDFDYVGDMEVVEPDGLRTKVKTKSFEEWMTERDWNEVLDAGKLMLKSVE
jgi:hypothetical protein